jgi:uncharacterized membrane protein
MSQEIITIVTAMTPIGELRASLPLALTVFEFSVWKAVGLSLLGNIIPVIAIVTIFGPVSQFLRKHSKLFDRFFDALFDRTRSKFLKKHQTSELIALLLFVAVPLPVTGGWTGALAAWLFGIPKKKSIPTIFAGLCIAACIVTILTIGIGALSTID